MRYLLLLFTFLFSNLLISQAQTCEWSATGGSFYKDWVYGITGGDRGSVIIAGYFTESATFGTSYVEAVAGTQDFFIANYSLTGRVIWAKSGGGTSNDVAYDVASDRFGNVYTTGRFIRNMQVDGLNLIGDSPEGNGFIAAYDVDGQFRFAQRISTQYQDIGLGITCDRQDRVITTGYASDSAQGNHQLFIQQLNNQGEMIWEKKASTNHYSEGWEVITNSQNDLFLLGIGVDSIKFNDCVLGFSTSKPHLFVAKFTADGDCQWIKEIAQSSLDKSGDIKVDTQGDIILTGHYTDKNNFGYFNLAATDQRDAFVAKLNTAGDFIWVKRASGRGFAEGMSISLDADNNIFVAGYFEQNMLLDLNPFQSEGWDDMFIAKYTATGGCEWLEHIGGKGHERAQGIHVNHEGDIYLTGAVGQQAEFYGCSITSNDCGEEKWLNCEDIFLVKLNDTGRTIYQKKPNKTRLIVSSFETTSRLLLVQFYQAEGSSINLHLVDVAGRAVFQKSFQAAYQSEINLQIPLTYFPTGIYFLNLSVDGVTVDSKKVFL